MNLSQTTGGTLLYANAASFTFSIVNFSKIILNSNCTVRTNLFALFAADTSVCTSLSCISALLLIAALYCNHSLLGYHIDDLLGTSLLTESATDTKSCIYVCDTVSKTDCL